MLEFLKGFKPPPRPARAQSSSKTLSYDMSDVDLGLRDTLRQWRKAKTIELDGEEWFVGDLLDARSFMSNDVLLRLVALAHFRLYSTREVLIRDVQWIWIDKHADELLAMMRRSHPLPPPPVPHRSHPSLPSHTTGNSSSSSTILAPLRPPIGKRQQKCGICKMPGHNKTTCRKCNCAAFTLDFGIDYQLTNRVTQ